MVFYGLLLMLFLSGSKNQEIDETTYQIVNTMTPIGSVGPCLNGTMWEIEVPSNNEKVIVSDDAFGGKNITISDETFTGKILISNQADFDNYKNKTFQPGDQILFKRGETFVGMFAPLGSGTEAAPIIIEPYGIGERPIIDNQGVFHNYPDIAAKESTGQNWSAFKNGKISAGVFLHNASYWEVNGLEITNTDGEDNEYDIYGILYYANQENQYKHIYVNDCYVRDCGKVSWDPEPTTYGSIKMSGGIWAVLGTLAGTNSVLDGWRVTNNRVERVAGVGMANQSDAVAFFINRRPISNPKNLWKDTYYGDNTTHTTGRNAIVVRVSENPIVEYNRVINSSMSETGNSIYNFNTVNCLVQYNEVSGNDSGGKGERGAFDADYYAINTIIQYNYSHGNEYFCAIMKKPIIGVTIRYNISINDHSGVINYGFNNADRDANGNYRDDQTGKILEDVKVYNNTHYFSTSVPHDIQLFVSKSRPLNSDYNNNIYYYAGGAAWSDGGIDLERRGFFTDFERNVYVGIPPHVTDGTAQTTDPNFIAPGQEPSDIDLHTMDELRNYRLMSTSPYLDGAIEIENNGGKNILGEAVDPNRYGAF